MSSQGATTMPPTDPTAAFDSMNMFMGNLEKTLGKSLQPLQKIGKQMSGSKFGKNVKALGGALKGMAGASINAWAMEQLMKLIEPFMNLLKLLEMPINVLAALLTIMVNEIFIDLIPYFLAFSMILIDLIPLFKEIGQVLGPVFVWILQKIYGRFKFVYTLWKEIFTFLAVKFLPIWKKIKDFFEPFTSFLAEKFKPLWEGIKIAFDALKTAWAESGGKIFGKDGFISKGFKALIAGAKAIVNGVLGSINNIITSINESTGWELSTVPLLREGGFTLGEGLAQLHPNEFVVPLEKAPAFAKDPEALAEQEEQTRILGLILRYQKEQSEWQL